MTNATKPTELYVAFDPAMDLNESQDPTYIALLDIITGGAQDEAGTAAVLRDEYVDRVGQALISAAEAITEIGGRKVTVDAIADAGHAPREYDWLRRNVDYRDDSPLYLAVWQQAWDEVDPEDYSTDITQSFIRDHHPHVTPGPLRPRAI